MFHATFSLGHGRILNAKANSTQLLSYSFTRAEKEDIEAGFATLISLMKESKAKTIIPGINGNQRKLAAQDLDRFVSSEFTTSNLQMSAVHLFGGVTAGEDADCVADSFGKIQSEENLFVNDASLINTTLLKNPQGTVMLLALRNIEAFLKHSDLHQIEEF